MFLFLSYIMRLRITSILAVFVGNIVSAVLAQLVEHFHGKEKVPGSIPGNGSRIEYFSILSRLSSSGRATAS